MAQPPPRQTELGRLLAYCQRVKEELVSVGVPAHVVNRMRSTRNLIAIGHRFGLPLK